MIEAYITNLGRYNEGHLDGEFLKLPATREDVQSLLQRIHVDGVRYEEVFITDYNIESVDGLYEHLGEYESIDELNYLAALLEEMPDYQRSMFEAAVAHGDHHGSVKELINLTENLDGYQFIPDVENHEDLGRYYVEEMDMLEVPDHLLNYIDYEAYGRDMALDDNGQFVDGGYILQMDDSFTEHYNGTHDDIPEEYRIFAYPEPTRSILDSLRHYEQMISEAPVLDRSVPTHDAQGR